MVVMHNVPPAFAEKRRHEPVIRPHPETGLARTVRTKQVVQIAVMIVFGEAHLVGSLGQYAAYYNESRIAHSTKMLHIPVRLSASASSNHGLSLGAFITNIAESDFRYTQVSLTLRSMVLDDE